MRRRRFTKVSPTPRKPPKRVHFLLPLQTDLKIFKNIEKTILEESDPSSFNSFEFHATYLQWFLLQTIIKQPQI